MTINYPLTLPNITRVSSVAFTSLNNSVRTESPFTFQGQTQITGAERWLATITLPPMHRDKAAVWSAWLTSLRGEVGTFYMGNPMAPLSQGTARTLPGNPKVNGVNQSGQDLIINGATASQVGWLKAGDYIQLNAGGAATLHKVLVDVTSDANGVATLSLWPSVRAHQIPAHQSIVVVSNAVGRWRLKTNSFSWTVDKINIYGINFSAVEDI